VTRYLLRRAGGSLIALVLASVIVFVGVRSLPGDPAVALSGEGRDPAVINAIRAKYGLDQPLPAQYLRWVTLAAVGDLGSSAKTGASVSRIVLERIPVTVQLALMSLFAAMAIGIPLGVLSAVRRGDIPDYVGSGVALLGLSMPTFWLGIVLILVFAIALRWLPASGYVSPFTDPLDSARRMLLPAVVLGSGFGAVLMRQVRSAMVESLQADYVRTARAKGLSEARVVGIHALRNSLITVVTIVGLELGALISGSVVTEQIFLIPGFGRLVLESISTRDYPLIQGVALFSAAGYILLNLLVDVLYSLLNPRIRVSRFGA
jgi:peptide/nickel transport system permease protein